MKKDKRIIKTIIKQVMAKNNIKTGTLAHKLGIESPQMSVWLAREDNQTFNKLIQIADIMNCDIALVDRTTGEVFK